MFVWPVIWLIPTPHVLVREKLSFAYLAPFTTDDHWPLSQGHHHLRLCHHRCHNQHCYHNQHHCHDQYRCHHQLYLLLLIPINNWWQHLMAVTAIINIICPFQTTRNIMIILTTRSSWSSSALPTSLSWLIIMSSSTIFNSFTWVRPLPGCQWDSCQLSTFESPECDNHHQPSDHINRIWWWDEWNGKKWGGHLTCSGAS